MKATVIKLFADDYTGLLHNVGEVLVGDIEAYIERGLAEAIPEEDEEKSVVEEVEKPKKATRKKQEDK